ncbi:TetR/AcrR family transcriptional regulator [Umezawaea sp. Da 62-37]|uniref:TetR/AcrR family transcriptional regulator n=1 Tax=Umezawaea sp. Da 62-37 TaxID=3075927 RepID=UPI0028F6CF14|nr:TetR/AcrR family transcriptional regulator [Umezawaea sp. Da 62-37]WNV85595.1 TetR/AcrR family transcriptional regulator [Umezawaea sp. Da 62-37]
MPKSTARSEQAGRVDLALLPERALPPGAHGRLLCTAVELFAARGYHGVSVRDLAAAMDVKASSVYAHYPSKEELFHRVVSVANEEIAHRLRDALLAADPHPARTLADVIGAYVTFHADYPLLATVGHNDLHVLSGPSLHKVSQLRKQAVELVLSIVERGNATGDFACDKPHLAVAAIAGMGIRVASWYRAPDRSWDRPADGYAEVMADVMPAYTARELADEYTRYVLALVGHRDRDTS